MSKRPFDIFKLRTYKCPRCKDEKLTDLKWASDPLPHCKECKAEMHEYHGEPKMGSAPSVHGDECDVVIRHGICNPDGSPKRYTSKSDMKKAAFEAGYVQGDDTPKPNPKIVEQRQADQESRSKQWER